MEASRYSRQILFEPIGGEEGGQLRLSKSHVLIIGGVGALGSISAETLTRAGVGKLTLVDRDYVEESNLQRQQLFTEKDVINQTPKAIAAKERLESINHLVKIDAMVMDADVSKLEQIIPKVHLVIDATDNFETRLLINDLCQKYRKPWIYGGCVASYGITFTVLPNETPCLQCLMKHIPQDGATCDTVGIVSPVVQMVVSHQMIEAFKILTGNKQQLSGKLIAFDLWQNQRMELAVESLRKKDCPSCSENKQFPNLSYEQQLKTAVLCGRNTVQIRSPPHKQVHLEEIARHLQKKQSLKVFQNPYLLSFEIENHRMVVFQDGRTLIHGTKDLTEAKKLYYQFIG
ncbi:ThiF family adenylyltransferase [Gracilibacillus sp. JCM 18860]|uniref:ThiF family adenylyltransferase n=1 Tax=Gracilibacillus sp. JCM 18860 TaxID=1306159 RepID=UPI0006CFFBD7